MNVAPHALSNVEKRAWLRLARTDKVGPITFRQLLARYGSAQAALQALPDLARAGGARSFVMPTWPTIDDEIARVHKAGGTFVFLSDPAYPRALSFIEDAPPVLTVLGHLSLFQKKAIGVVGARNASLSGRKMAEKLAKDLGTEGFVVASGLARGIDTAAHQASLPSGTIAVVAGGVDVVYPEENRDLYQKIAETGLIVAEQPLTTQPRAQLFPCRNRVIAGLSLGVVVVEAARKSGSLITARYALEQGREVFAVPGSPLDPRAEGPNHLIKQGAVLTEKASDILEHIYALPTALAEADAALLSGAPLSAPSETELAAARSVIAENLGPCPVLVDELARGCHLSLPLVLTILLELELAGRLERQPGNRVALIG